jgi:hypothetical protein
MTMGETRFVTAVQRSSLGSIVAGLGTCGLTAYTWWSARGGVPTPDVSAVIVLLIPIGFAAGLISGRFRGAPLSWAAAVVGSVLAYQLTSAIDPGLPAQQSSFTGYELNNAAFLVPFVGGGHLLGTWAGNAGRRGLLGAVLAGMGTCGLCLIGWQLNQVYGPGGTASILVWVVIAAWVVLGALSGLVSGRVVDAPASWAVAVTAFMLAYMVFHGIPEGSSGPVEELLYAPVSLLVFIAAGHLLGAAGRAVALRSLGRAPVRKAEL